MSRNSESQAQAIEMAYFFWQAFGLFIRKRKVYKRDPEIIKAIEQCEFHLGELYSLLLRKFT